ncbi:hypothetical protein PLANPX_2549 [Lacipirellula parvula]|uniref:Uncharacterized protein n=1 Tax=Lacipirellula parvula TaxID=2650471 RepID=A0A5K7XAH7_9BACT|nr:hypothetical protein PLANPX_2549 [Lacipirellula parvula]
MTIFEETKQTFPATRAKIKPNCVDRKSLSHIAHAGPTRSGQKQRA